jgi:hypothetical protein
MKRTNMMTLAIAALALLAITSGTSAALYFSEDFNYTSGQDIAGKTGGTGLETTTGWSYSNANATGTVVSGLTFGSLVTSGNALEVTQSSATFSSGYISRGITATATADNTLWGAALYNYASHSGQVNQAIGIDSGPGYETALIPNRGWNTYPSVAYGDNDDSFFDVSPRGDNAGTTYLFIGKWTNIGGDADTSTAEGWMFDLAAFNSLVAAGITEANLDTYAISQTAPLTGTTVPVTDQDLNLGGTIGAGGDITATMDEIRFGDDLGSVIPVPEPATMGLLGLGGLALLRRRRK